MWHLLDDLDLLSFLDDLNINYETSGKNIGEGWVGLDTCPFNGCENYHFGINISNKSINCWVCDVDGTIIKLLMKYFNISKDEAFLMIKEHIEEIEFTQDTDIESLVHKTFSKTVKKVEEDKPMPKIKLLPGKPITKEMVRERTKLRAFLKERMISVDSCVKHSFRYDYERSMRIIMPIFSHKGDIISYQGRDITGKAILNINNYFGHKYVIVVEGILDVIRTEHFVKEYNLNKKVCVLACFTNSPTENQLQLLSDKDLKSIIVAMDSDSWYNERKFRDLPFDIETVILSSGVDPGSMSDIDFKNEFIPIFR